MPTTRILNPTDVQKLRSDGVQFAIVSFIDNAGILRAKCVPVGQLESLTKSGIGASYTFGVFTGADSIAQSRQYGNRIGDLRLVGDAASLRSHEEWAWIAAYQYDQEGEPWPLDPRGFLERMVALAASRQLTFKMAWELEFFAGLDADKPINHGPAYGAQAITESMRLFERLVQNLTGFGVAVTQFHAEYGAGCLEVALAARQPLEAADESVMSRWLVHRAAHAEGTRASFAPVVAPSAGGNGHHMHVSLWRGEENLFGSDKKNSLGITSEGAAFLGGILEHLPALVALGCASPISHLRLKPGLWTGAYKCWGTENREAAIRFIRGSKALRPGATNAEIKCFDASGNPYLVAGAVIAAGLDGIDRGLTLPPEADVDPGSLTENERLQRGFTPLSASLDTSAKELSQSSLMRRVMGDHLVDAIVAVREAESAIAATRSPEELLDSYRWRY